MADGTILELVCILISSRRVVLLYFEISAKLNDSKTILVLKIVYSKKVVPGIPWTSSRPSSPLGAKKIFGKNFRPSRCTGRWNFATNGGISQHFLKRLNALNSARIESREDSKTRSVAEIGKNGYFFVSGTKNILKRRFQFTTFLQRSFSSSSHRGCVEFGVLG